MLSVGSEAPDFTLPDQDGMPVTLSKLRGKNVVLIFYPGDDTPTCTKQLCEVRDNWGLVQSKDTVVFGVNPWSAAKHTKFRTGQQFPFSLLVDKGQRVGSIYKTRWLWVRRTVYLIGKDGKIRYAQRGFPSIQEVMQAAA